MARKPGVEAPSDRAKERPLFRRTLKRFRRRVRELRQEHGLSYNELAQRADVNWRHLVAIEKGEPCNPTLVTLTRLAEAFGVEPQDLISPVASGVRAKTPAKTAPPARGGDVVDLDKAAKRKSKAGET